jgi:hypothetical protein
VRCHRLLRCVAKTLRCSLFTGPETGPELSEAPERVSDVRGTRTSSGAIVAADLITGGANGLPDERWAVVARTYFEQFGYPDVGSPELDPRALVIEAATASLREDVKNATPGRLGVSASGLQGDIDMSLQSLMRSTSSLQGLTTMAGAKADAAGETWQGLRPLLRTVAKIADRDISLAALAGRYIVSFPVLAPLWADGLISASQVRAIGDEVSAFPTRLQAEVLDDLAAKALVMTDRQLRYEARMKRNEVLPGREDQDADKADRNAYLSIYPEGDMYGIKGRLTVEGAGWLKTVLDALTSVVATDDRRTFAERQADALVTMCRQYASSDVIPTLAMATPRFIVLTRHEDVDAIANNVAPADFPVTTFGDRLDPITVRRMLSDAEIVPVLADDGSTQTLADVALDRATAERVKATATDFAKRRRRKGAQRGAPPTLLRLLMTPVRPLALGRSVRIVPGWLRDVVSLRDVHCTVDGCDVPAHRCEVHHVQPWAQGGATDIENLALLCVRHHRGVERGTWYLRPRRGSDRPGRYWLATAVRA